jgi:hypothetical protein
MSVLRQLREYLYQSSLCFINRLVVKNNLCTNMRPKIPEDVHVWNAQNTQI